MFIGLINPFREADKASPEKPLTIDHKELAKKRKVKQHPSSNSKHTVAAWKKAALSLSAGVISTVVTSAGLALAAPAQSEVLRGNVYESVVNDPVVEQTGLLLGLNRHPSMEKVVEKAHRERQERLASYECILLETPHANERGLTYYCGEAG